ncbi:MAG: hypothetical protein WD851_24850 [Pirellulales bacterium]
MSTATIPAAGPMGEHYRVFWRFAWKEYRMLRGFWLAVAALAVMIQLITLATLPASPDRSSMLFNIALGATVLYAVGAAATLFAVEHEEETYDLLTTLPVEWLPVFLAKLLVAITSSAALGAVLVGSSFAVGGPWNRDTAYLLLPAVAESIAWGIFLSLTSRRPLVAAVATIAVVSVQVNLVMSLMTEQAVAIQDANNYPPAMWWRLTISALVLLMDVALGREWLRMSTAKHESVWNRFGRSKSEMGSAQDMGVSTRRMMSRLLWQTWRESWWPMGLMMLFAAAAGMFGAAVVFALEGPHIKPESAGAIMFAFAVFLSAIYATGVFGSDQRARSYRFLAEHGARPRLVWFCRHVVWIGVILALITTAAAIVAILYAEEFQRWAKGEGRARLAQNAYWNPDDLFLNRVTDTQASIDAITVILIGTAAGYAAGQLCSILIRRSLSAGLLSLIVAALLTAWGWVIWAWNVPGGWAFAFLPIIAGLLLASWLRARDWIIERHTLGGWLGFAAVLALPCIGAVLYVGAVRVIEVEQYPPVAGSRPIDDPVDYSTDELAKAAGRELVRAMGEIVSLEQLKERQFPSEDDGQIFSALGPSVWRRMLLEENQTALDIAIPASKAGVVYFDDASDQGSAKLRLAYLAERLLESGDAFTSYKKLDRALQCYLATLRVVGHARRDLGSREYVRFFVIERRTLHRLIEWSITEGQTSESLLGALAQLNEVIPTTPEQWRQAQAGSGYLPPMPSNRQDYRIIRDAITTGPSLASHLPFERVRALRVLELIEDIDWQSGGKQLQTMFDGTWDSQLREDLEPTGVIARELRQSIISAQRLARALRSYEYRDVLPPPWSWLSTTYFLASQYERRTDLALFLMTAVDLYTLQRAVKLQFALVAYRWDHGDYPSKLNELIPRYLAEMPRDPYTGDAFQYEPTGLAGELTYGNSNPSQQLAAHTPFFWSAGYRGARLTSVQTAEPRREEFEPELGVIGPTVEEMRTVYQFESSLDNWGADPMVFPLPPVIPANAAPAPPGDEAQ